MIADPPPADGVAAIRAALGERVSTGDETLWRLNAAGRAPRCVVEPGTVEQAVAAVRLAAEHRLDVVPAGNGTHLGIGWPPAAAGAAVSTRRLARLLAHEAGDLTVRVEAGVTLAALNDALAAAGQWLPLDPPRAGEMTIGGLIAADRNGPLRYGFGGVRDWLIGLRVVMADGQIVRGGGQVVKNVAGYDLPRLFIGSYGTLGLIVEATFKVRPQLAGLTLFEWTAGSLRAALARAQALAGSDVLPVLVETVNESAAEALGLDSGASLLIGCGGPAEHREEQARRLAVLSDGAALRHANERGDALLRALREFSQPADEDALVARLSVLPTALGALLAEVEERAAAARVVAEIAAHAGNGVAWCQLLGAPGDEVLAALAGTVRDATRRHGGWAVFESMPAGLRGQLDPWGFDGAALAVMRRVKAALDPAGLFSPGRFVGGI